MKNARKCESCHAQVTPRTTSWIMVQRTTRAFVVSDWSRNSASRSCAICVSLRYVYLHSKCRTLWKTCSLRTSCSLEFKSWTFCTSVCTLSLSVLSILLVSPMAISSVNLTVPCTPVPNQPPPEGTFCGVTQMRCWPESAALKVNLPCCEPRCATMRWLLSNVSSTVTKTPTSLLF
jgi:hypothetical protein